ncbi:MAG: phage integrase SAM-like domain-containing protein [Bacteroidota bacterium]
MSAKFYLKDKNKPISSLSIIIRFKSELYKFSSHISVQTRYWNQDKQRLKESPAYLDAIYINQAIIMQENVYNDAIRYYISKQISPSQKTFKNKVKELFSLINTDDSKNNDLFLNFFYDVKEKYKTIRSAGTIKNYNVFYNKLLEYETENKLKLTFADIDEKFYLHFREWFFKQNYSINYFANFIKTIKMLMTLANEQGLSNSTDYKLKSTKKITKESDNIYLTVEELLKIYHLDFSKFPILNHPGYYLARNKFLIGAFTGISVSNFNRLNEINLSDNFIRSNSTKPNAS